MSLLHRWNRGRSASEPPIKPPRESEDAGRSAIPSLRFGRAAWEVAQDEQKAHEALDDAGVPRALEPPDDLILSVAGRVRLLTKGKVW